MPETTPGPIALPDLSRGKVFLFDRPALDAIITNTLPNVPKDKTWMVGWGVDLNGASVGVVFTRDTASVDWEARAAIGYGRKTGLTVAASGTISGD